MTVQQLIDELQRIVKEAPERGRFEVEDREKRTIGWVRRGSIQDDRNRIVAVLPEVDY